MNIAVGSQVWVDDAELAWVDGEVKALNAREATIITSHGNTVRTCLPASPIINIFGYPTNLSLYVGPRWLQISQTYIQKTRRRHLPGSMT